LNFKQCFFDNYFQKLLQNVTNQIKFAAAFYLSRGFGKRVSLDQRDQVYKIQILT